MGSLYIEALGCVPVLLENLCGMSFSGTCLCLGGAWFQCRCLMRSCQLTFPGVRSSLVFQDLDLSLLLLVFSIIFTLSSRFIHLYSTNDKISRLKMKSFSTMRSTQRCTELHGEEKKEQGDRGDQGEMRWNQKRREQDIQ